MDFDGQTVMVTGAAGNLGRAVAQSFAERGANLVVLDQQQAALDQVFGPGTGKWMSAACDLLDQKNTQAAVDGAKKRFGRIDVLCNIAGGFRMGEPVHATSDGTWNFLFDLNGRTLLHTVRAVVPGMVEQGSGKIVNVGAFAAQRGVAEMGAYVASKAAVIRLTEAMAAELRDKGINVNCVLPTIIDTPQNRQAMPDADPGKWVSPLDLAEVIVFLASKAARAVHGAALPVSGLS